MDLMCYENMSDIVKFSEIKEWENKIVKIEDEALKILVEKCGNKWSLISKWFYNKTGKQCRDRYNLIKHPIDKSKWKKSEDDKLIELYNQFGAKWCEISKIMKNRSESSVKNHWYSCMRMKKSNYLKKALIKK